MASEHARGWMHVSIIGQLQDDPVLAYSPKGQPKTKFRVLVQYRKRPGYESTATRITRVYVDCTLGGKGAEVAVKYGRKGGWIFVGHGRIVTRSGKLSVAIDQFHFLHGAPTVELTVYSATPESSGRGRGRWSGSSPRMIRPRAK